MRNDHPDAAFNRQFKLFSPSSEVELARAQNFSLRLDEAGFLKPPHDLEPSAELAFHIGYLPAIFVYLPLPFKNPGSEFEKVSGIYRVVLSSPPGCPYGKTGRSVLSIVTTLAVSKRTRFIELGSLRSTLSMLDRAASGGKRGGGRPTIMQFIRIANTTVHIYRSPRGSIVKTAEARRFVFASADSLRWIELAPNSTVPLNICLQLTTECYAYLTAHSIPMLLEVYFRIQSPRQQDLLAWLTRSFWNLTDQTGRLVRWQDLYEQFGPVSASYRPQFRDELSTYLDDIKYNIYPAAKRKANLDVTPEGIILYPSDPLVDPEDKRAGSVI